MADLLIPHIDDLGGSHAANAAMLELSATGSVTSGSVMVPPGWFPQIASDERFQGLDLGIHLTITSESVAFRWGPTTVHRGGLTDGDGYLWPTVPEVRAHADPGAVDEELRAQLDRALAAGLDVTHVDHHMGAALSPEFVHNTVAMAVDYDVPMLFPGNLAEYAKLVDMGPTDVEVLEDARREAVAHGVAVGDTFVMPLIHHTDPQPERALLRALDALPSGVTYMSLHCAAGNEIIAIHPNDAEWRILERRMFADASFIDRLRQRELSGMRRFRDELRSR